jgi:dTDP-4-dehydrorhamnose reductase
MRILILGGSGMLGHKLVQRLSPRFDLFTTVRDSGKSLLSRALVQPSQLLSNIDVRDDSALIRAIESTRPNAVINAIGIVKQHSTANDVINTLTINSILPHKLSQLGQLHGFRLITISTDCVFAGDKGHYSEADSPDATDLYGRSKNIGEATEGNCLAIRSSIIGRELDTSHGLIEWFLSNRRGRVNGFANAIYSGFPTIVFADIIGDLLLDHPDLQGLYHISSDPIDKFRLLSLANDAFGSRITVDPNEDFKIDRSLDSTRFRSATGFTPASWEEMIEQMAKDPTPYDDWRK